MSGVFSEIDLDDPQATTAVCVLASAVAGTGIGFFGCVLSYADKQRALHGGEHTSASRRLHLLGAVGSSFFGIASLVGLFFGPVSLVVVVRAGSTLPANALFSHAFGLRDLVREDYLGTVITIAGVICFAIFQGAAAHVVTRDELFDSLQRPEAITFLAAMFVLFLASLGCAKALTMSGRSAADEPGLARSPSSPWWSRLVTMPPKTRAFALAFAVNNIAATSSAFMDLSTKAWSASLTVGLARVASDSTFWVAIFFNLFFLVSMRMAMIYGCARTDVMVFVPMNTVGNVVLSASMGMVVLLEYDEVSSWLGMCATFVSLLCGILLLIAGPSGFEDGSDGFSLAEDSGYANAPDKRDSMPASSRNLLADGGATATATAATAASTQFDTELLRRMSMRAAEIALATNGTDQRKTVHHVARREGAHSRPPSERQIHVPGVRAPGAPLESRPSAGASDLCYTKRRPSIFELQANSSVALTTLNRAQARQAVRRHEVEDMRKELHEMAALLRTSAQRRNLSEDDGDDGDESDGSTPTADERPTLSPSARSPPLKPTEPDGAGGERPRTTPLKPTEPGGAGGERPRTRRFETDAKFGLPGWMRGNSSKHVSSVVAAEAGADSAPALKGLEEADVLHA